MTAPTSWRSPPTTSGGASTGSRPPTCHAAITERDAFARLWNREAVLGRSALLIDAEDDDAPEVAAAVDGLVRRLLGPVAVSSPALVPFPDLVATFAVNRPTRHEQEDLWRAVLPATPRP